MSSHRRLLRLEARIVESQGPTVLFHDPSHLVINTGGYIDLDLHQPEHNARAIQPAQVVENFD